MIQDVYKIALPLYRVAFESETIISRSNAGEEDIIQTISLAADAALRLEFGGMRNILRGMCELAAKNATDEKAAANFLRNALNLNKLSLLLNYEKELAGERFFYLSSKEFDFYEQVGDRAFSPAIFTHYPTIEKDIRAAGRCYATATEDDYTACVFHLMRAMEIGVQILAREKFGIDLQDARGKDKEWSNLVDELEKKKNEMPHTTTPEKEKQALFGHAIHHFANVKADRARAFHSRDLKTAKYDAHEAAYIYEEVRRFYVQMNSLHDLSIN